MAEIEKNKFRLESMLEFPDFSSRGFDIETYNARFVNSNYIIHVSSKEVSFPTHWGPLGIKCAFGGSEFYRAGNGVFGADQDNFLILNNGTDYSSWIDSNTAVESLAINFSPAFEREVIATLNLSPSTLLSDPASRLPTGYNFTERLYRYDPEIRSLVNKIRVLSKDVYSNKEQMKELLYGLMEYIVRAQENTRREIASIKKLRASTRTELFQRLLRAKDFIYSCYQQNLSLETIAQVACLNEYYFLREFKRAYAITPHQYLTNRRLQVASELLKASRHSVTEICSLVGFSDSASFSKLFKRNFGKTPIEFRRVTC